MPLEVSAPSLGMVAILRLLTAPGQTPVHLAAGLTQFRPAFFAACFFHLNEKLRITKWDSDCELMTGWSADKVLDKPIEALTVKGFRPDVHTALLQPNAHKGRAIEFDLITPQRSVTRLALTACESVDHLSRWQFSIPEDEQTSTISAQVVTAIMRKSHDLLFITDTKAESGAATKRRWIYWGCLRLE